MRPLDLLLAVLAPVIALWLCNADVLPGRDIEVGTSFVLVSAAATAISFAHFSIGRPFSQFFCGRDAIRILMACGGAVLLATGVVFVFADVHEVSRSLPALHFFVLTFLMMGSRLVAAEFGLRRQTHDLGGESAQIQNIVVIGANRLTWFYIRLVDTFYSGQQRVVAVLDPRQGSIGRAILGHKVIGTPSDISAQIDEYAVHGVCVSCVMIALQKSEMAPDEWAALEATCQARGIHWRSLPDLLSIEGVNEGLADAFSPEVQSRIETIQGRRIWKLKRAADLVVSSVALIACIPLFMVIGILVFCDGSGRVVFWQQRLGRNGDPIFVYKFRTMRRPLDRHGNRRPDDARLSVIGKALRATRLDELPQLVNILLGTMSVTGPRPLLPVDQPNGPSVRLAVSPGLTGWAQVSGGRLINAEEKSALDEWYIRSTNVALEIRILLLTVLVVFRGDVRNEGAIRTALAEMDQSWRDRPLLPAHPHWELPPMDNARRQREQAEVAAAGSAARAATVLS